MKSPFSDNRTKSREVEVHRRVVAQKSCGINLLFLIITDVHFPSVCIFKASRRRKENKETTVKSQEVSSSPKHMKRKFRAPTSNIRNSLALYLTYSYRVFTLSPHVRGGPTP